jgi:hypothetical protein
MVKIIGSLMLSVLLVSLALATGPVRPALEDESVFTGVGSIESLWGLDVVAWAPTGNALTAFGRAGSGLLGNWVYCFGSEAAPLAQAYNVTTGTWSASTLPTFARDNWDGVATTNAIYLVGRFDNGVYGTEVQKFVPTGSGPTGTWSQVAPYPVAGCGMAAAWDGGDLIYAGGGGTSTFFTNAYKYSISANTWTAIANLPTGMKYCGGAWAGGKFHILGGASAAIAALHYGYDPATNTWATLAPIPTPLYFATFETTVGDGKIITIGGGGVYSTAFPGTNAVQIYDPATNTWTQETPLPVVTGLGTGEWLGSGEAVALGGYIAAPLGYTTNCYRGTGFFGGAPPNVTVTLLPVNPPIIIPPTGGPFDWDITLHNGENSPQIIDIWNIISGPATRPGWGPVLDLTLPAGATINRIRTQYVSDRFPAGAYTYTSNIGQYPSTVWDSDSFPFTKTAVGADGWAIGQSTTATPSEYAVHGASPNPFNPTTTLSFALPQAGQVKLSVYNVTGREVATLVNGLRDAGNHEVTFDATGLASGLYIYQLTAGDFNATGKMMLTK